MEYGDGARQVRVMWLVLVAAIACGSGKNDVAAVQVDPFAKFAGRWRVDSSLGNRLPAYTSASATDSARQESIEFELHTSPSGIGNYAEYRDSSYAKSFIPSLGWWTTNRTNSGVYNVGWLGNDLYLTLRAGTAPGFLQFRLSATNRLQRMYGSEAGSDVWVKAP